MNPNRIMLLNAALFCVIVALAMLIILQERQLPGEPPVDELRAVVSERIAQLPPETEINQSTLVNLPRKNVFQTILPLPTSPPPTPAPTVAPVSILEVTDSWVLQGAMTNFAALQDIRTKEDFTMRLNDEREVKYKNQTYKVKLVGLVKMKSATFKMEHEGNIQHRTIDNQF